jgi:hypothetical protein
MTKMTWALIWALLAATAWTAPAEAADIVLDGEFGDWAGQANAPDAAGDADNDHTDLQAFYFADNPGVEMAYFMAERWQAGSQSLTLNLHVDTNNDGSYSGADDRRVLVAYSPNPGGRANVDLYSGTGAWLKRIASNANWGESGSGSWRVEWGVSFADLGIVAFQTVRVQLVSLQGNSVSDSAPEVQWSPANAMGWPLLAAVAGAGLTWLIYRRRKLR